MWMQLLGAQLDLPKRKGAWDTVRHDGQRRYAVVAFDRSVWRDPYEVCQCVDPPFKRSTRPMRFWRALDKSCVSIVQASFYQHGRNKCLSHTSSKCNKHGWMERYFNDEWSCVLFE